MCIEDDHTGLGTGLHPAALALPDRSLHNLLGIGTGAEAPVGYHNVPEGEENKK